jgi:hypothetical protein
MGRPLLKEEEKLSHSIIVRVNEATFKRLEKLAENSGCRTVAEVVRRIVLEQRMVIFHKDSSMNGPMEELALIRKELKAIGININQQTHYFHIAQSAAERAFYVNRTAALYREVDLKVNRLLLIVGKLAEQWLQK